MRRIIGALGGTILASAVAAAQAQPLGAWAPVCEIDARTNTEICHADMTTAYRRNTVLVSVGTDDERPSVSLQVTDTEVRYAQMRVGDAPAARGAHMRGAEMPSWATMTRAP